MIFFSSLLRLAKQFFLNFTSKEIFAQTADGTVLEAFNLRKPPFIYARCASHIFRQYMERKRIFAKKCPPSCDKMVYSWGRFVTYSKENLNITKIKIQAFSADVKPTTEVLLFPLSSLLSEVGGSLGLWLGLSVISVFEIFDFLGSVIQKLTSPASD